MSGQTTWTGGTMSGTGTTVADGTLQLGASGDTGDVQFLTVRTLEVSGGGTLESQDTLEQSYGSTFVNTASTRWTSWPAWTGKRSRRDRDDR